MSDSDLMDMGISAVGDRVKRKAFCKGDGVSKDDKRSEMKKLGRNYESFKESDFPRQQRGRLRKRQVGLCLIGKRFYKRQQILSSCGKGR